MKVNAWRDVHSQEVMDNVEACVSDSCPSAISQKANAMLVRFKVNNIAYGWQTVNIIWQYVKQDKLANQSCHFP